MVLNEKCSLKTGYIFILVPKALVNPNSYPVVVKVDRWESGFSLNFLFLCFSFLQVIQQTSKHLLFMTFYAQV